MAAVRKKRVIGSLSAAALALLLFAAVFCIASNAAVIKRGAFSDGSDDGEKYDCVLILGALVREDGSPSAMLADRLDRGIELYFSGRAGKILVSGDHGTKDYDEVNAMKAYCVSAGVPSEDVFMDHAGFSTYESMNRAKTVFGCEKVIVVTQGYHLYRAVYDGKKAGLVCVGAPADQRTYAGQRMRDAREFLARAKDVVYCALHVSPKYGGEPVPISGDGNVTNDKTALYGENSPS